MKRLMLICLMILCLVPMAFAETAADSSFDFGFSRSGDGFSPGTVLYLPDFTGTGSQWKILAVSGGNYMLYSLKQNIEQEGGMEGYDPVLMYESIIALESIRKNR